MQSDSISCAWIAAMRRGAFAEAWAISDRVLDARRRTGDRRRDQPLHLTPLWDGTQFAGRDVLVRCHHGLGDSIQFLRLAAPLRTRAARVTVQAQAALLPPLAGLPGADRLLALDGPEPPHEVAIESTELPHALRLTIDDIPPPCRLRLPTARPRRWDELRVGLAWRGGDWDKRRSVPPAALAPIGTLPDVALVNLQLGATGDEIAPLSFAEPSPPDASILATARRIASLDLVIAIDSMVAHLAGTLGAPVWLLLHEDADWRWMRGRDDSPWYPTMRLFRQEVAGDWRAPIDRLCAALAAHDRTAA